MQSRIPKRIIQTGREINQPLRIRAMIANLKLLNPDFEYVYFDESKVESFMNEEFPEYRRVFDSFAYPIQKYDFFRYLVVYRLGGFYFDLDMMLAEPLTSLLRYSCVFPFEGLTLSQLLISEYQMDWEIGNYAFGAAAGHPFLKKVVENCIKSQNEPEWIQRMMKGVPFLSRSEYRILYSTGPGLVSRTLAENADLSKSVKVLFPEDVSDAKSWNRFGDYGVHLMEGSWRFRKSLVLRRIEQIVEGQKIERLIRQSRKLGKTRNHVTLEDQDSDERRNFSAS